MHGTSPYTAVVSKTDPVNARSTSETFLSLRLLWQAAPMEPKFSKDIRLSFGGFSSSFESSVLQGNCLKCAPRRDRAPGNQGLSDDSNQASWNIAIFGKYVNPGLSCCTIAHQATVCVLSGSLRYDRRPARCEQIYHLLKQRRRCRLVRFVLIAIPSCPHRIAGIRRASGLGTFILWVCVNASRKRRQYPHRQC